MSGVRPLVTLLSKLEGSFFNIYLSISGPLPQKEKDHKKLLTKYTQRIFWIIVI